MSGPTETTTERGFSGYDEFTDLYGSRITLQQSSRAFHPAVWLRVEACHAAEGGLNSDGSGHLSLPQAKRLRTALDSFVTEAEQLIADGLYWPESDEQPWPEDETAEQAAAIREGSRKPTVGKLQDDLTVARSMIGMAQACLRDNKTTEAMGYLARVVSR